MDLAVDQNPIASSLVSCHLFRGIEADTMQMLTDAARLLQFERGQNIFLRGQADFGLFLVRSGQVKLSLLSSSGSERVIDVVFPGGTFGESMLFARPHNPQPSLSAEMLNSGELIEISRPALTHILKQCPALSMAMLSHLGAKLCRLVSELETCCLRSARERVIDYLLLLLDEQGSPDAESLEVRLPASKGIVASLLDLTPETFSRELQRLIRQGLIEMDRKTIWIPDIDVLRRSVC